jgi:hypothetical protein
MGERPNESLFLVARQSRLRVQHRFAATVRSPAAAFFSVIARARRTHSAVLTSGATRKPPIEAPQATLSTTSVALRPTFGSCT